MRAASVLNNSNICTINEIDEANGQHFIAMELLQGQKLKHRISGKPFPIEQLPELGTEFVDCLDAAHDKWNFVLGQVLRKGIIKMKS